MKIHQALLVMGFYAILISHVSVSFAEEINSKGQPFFYFNDSQWLEIYIIDHKYPHDALSIEEERNHGNVNSHHSAPVGANSWFPGDTSWMNDIRLQYQYRFN